MRNMLQQRLAALVLAICGVVWPAAAAVRFNHMKTISAFAPTTMLRTATAGSATEDTQTWQPSARRNNWIILQAASTTDKTLNLRQAKPHSNTQYNNAVEATTTVAAAATTPLQRLPVNYYAYNGSAGNYHSLTQQDMRDKQPYFLPISQRRRSSSSSSSSSNSNIIGSNTNINDNKLPQDNANIKRHYAYNDAQSLRLSYHLRQQDASDDNDNKGSQHSAEYQNIATTIQGNIHDDTQFSTPPIDNNSLAANEEQQHDLEQNEQRLNEALLPLGYAFDNVKRFSHVLQEIIDDDADETDDADDSESIDLAATPGNEATVKMTTQATADATPTTTTTTTTTVTDVTALLTARVQGHTSAPAASTTATPLAAAATTSTTTSAAAQQHSLAPATATARAATTTEITTTPLTTSTSATLTATPATTSVGTGRGKKFKKQLKKLMLPLLIAYKLKFLTLVPVLVGGLTLLVGTTGLAGFFFALFTAVMSLKSGGGGGSSKSIIVKKVYD